MKKKLWTYVAVAWIGANLCHLSLGYTKELELLWTEHKLDDSVILQFSDMNEDQMVEHIRTHYPDIKILFLDLANDNLPLNLDITVTNFPEDKKAVQFYTTHPEYTTSLNTHFIAPGATLHPYFHLSDDSLDRPYESKTVILLNRNVTRSTIIHEFMHYFLNPSNSVQWVEMEGKKHHPICQQISALDDLVEKTTVKLEEVVQRQEQALSDAEAIENSSGFFTLFLDMSRMNLLINLSHLGEEMDVHRLLYMYRSELHLTELEWKYLSLGNAGNNFQMLLENVRLITEDSNFVFLLSTLELYPSHIQDRAQKLAKLINMTQFKANLMNMWYSGEYKKLETK